jgi:hypothetical protein
MSKMRVLALAVFSVLALGAVAASAAQAAEAEYVVAGGVLSGSEAFTIPATSGTYVLHAKPLGTNTTITCSSLKGSGTIKEGGASAAKLEFSSCVVSEVANCTVSEPIVTTVTDQLILESGTIVDKFSPEPGKPFTEITLNNGAKACSVKGTYKVEGSQVCSLSSPETEAASHELSCATSGSSLTLGGRAATFQSTAVAISLTSGNHYHALQVWKSMAYPANFPVIHNGICYRSSRVTMAAEEPPTNPPWALVNPCP